MTVQMMIAKDVLRPYVPTMAAEKPSIMQAKIDRTRAVPDQPEAPEPPQNVGAISYGGKEKPEEDDDEFLRQYRGRRR